MAGEAAVLGPRCKKLTRPGAFSSTAAAALSRKYALPRETRWSTRGSGQVRWMSCVMRSPSIAVTVLWMGEEEALVTAAAAALMGRKRVGMKPSRPGREPSTRAPSGLSGSKALRDV
jgi:hypothetical protein